MSKTDCKYRPELLAGQPIGMFHCPECGEMVIAGLPHHKRDDEQDAMFDKRDELYDAILGPDEDITDEQATAILDTYGITGESAHCGQCGLAEEDCECSMSGN